MSKAGPIKMNWWYQSIIEWMIENPDGYLYECARELGVTQPWLSCIIHSDAFKLAYEEARGEHFDNTSHTVISKMEGLALQSAELLSERLEREGEKLPIGQLQSTAELALKALGFTSHPPQGGTNVNIGIAVGRDVLAQSRAKMRELNSASGAPRLETTVEDGEANLELLNDPDIKVSTA